MWLIVSDDMDITFNNKIIHCGNTAPLNLLSRNGIHIWTPFSIYSDTTTTPRVR
jgi:hypothetical protein